MKQVLSVADLAIMYDIVKNEVARGEEFINCVYDTSLTNKQRQKKQEERKLAMSSNARYNSMLRLKKALETLEIEIETPKLEIEGQKNETD